MRNLLFIPLFLCALLYCSNDRIAGTADDVNTGSILGSIIKDPRSINDTVIVSLYRGDSSNGFPAHKTTPLKTLKTIAGDYRFDSLAVGVYRVDVQNDSIIVGEKNNISLDSDQNATVDIRTVPVINIMMSIQSDQNIIVTGISIENGKIKKLESGYVLKIAGVDTQSFEIKFDQNGNPCTTQVQIILGDDGTAAFKPATTSITITPSYKTDCLAPGAILCMPFDSGLAEDVSGNGNNGRIVGATPTIDRFGNPKGALLFNGKDNYVIVDSIQGIVAGNSPKTISGWFNSNNPDNYLQIFFGLGSPSNYYNFQIGIDHGSAESEAQFRINNGYEFYNARIGVKSDPYFDGRWHHCVLTYDDSTTRVYIDGLLKAESNVFAYALPEKPVLVLGMDIDLMGFGFNGALDDIRVFNRAIDADEVLLLYNQK
jgi:hypothetical protein